LKIETLAPYHLPHEEILLSIASSVIFKELELQDCPKLSLSEVIEQPQYGYTASASHEPVGVKFVRITDIQAGKIDWNSVPYCECEYPEKYLLQENDILFARTGGTTGKSFIVKGDIPDSIFASYLIRIRPKEGAISDFLYCFFQTNQYWSQIVTEKEGSAQPNVNGKKLSSLDIFVPAHSIQEAIANYLNSYKSKVYGGLLELPSLPMILKNAEKNVRHIESLMKRVEEARKLRTMAVEEAERFTKAYLEKLLSYLLNKYNPIEIKQIADVSGGKRLPKGGHLTEEKTSHPYIRVTDMKNHSVDLRDIKYLPDEICAAISKYTISSDDIYVTIAGTIGYPGEIPMQLDNANLTENAAKIVFKNKINKRFFLYELRSPFVQDQFKTKKTSAAQPKLALHRIASTKVALPPYFEQCHIAAHLNLLQAKVDELKRLQAETEKELEELVPSILEKAFKGKL